MHAPARRALSCLCLFVASAAASCALASPPEGVTSSIDAVVRASLEKKDSASYAVGVVKDGRLVLARGYGFADLENDIPATAETVYRLGSITKQFTSLAILQLAEAGKLSLDDELHKHLPDYPPQKHPITIHHLLNHTSGIKSYTSLPGFRAKMRQDMTHAQLLDFFDNEPLEFAPGDKWRYNNSGYYLLGMIVEKASGQTYAEYLRDHVFRPLGMSATRYGNLRPLIKHRAQGYRPDKFGFSNDDPMSMDAPGAAGALVSNVLDLIKWHSALEAGQFLSSESYEKLYRPTKLNDGTTNPYAYGWFTGELSGHRKLSHGGGINGFSTMIARYPDDRLAVIVLANTAGANVGRLETRIARRLLGLAEEVVVDLPIPERVRKVAQGKFQLENTKVELISEGEQLFIKFPSGNRDRLRHQGEGRFVPERNEELKITVPLDGDRADRFVFESDAIKITAPRAE